jgi:hypothetical protein
MVALLCPPRKEDRLLATPLAYLRTRWNAQSRTRRELTVIALAIGFGLLVLPWIIWTLGYLVLGPYAHGGALRFLGDYFVELASGNPAFWTIAVGPCAFLLAVRLLWAGWRRAPLK